jgi:hypothetical protein
MQFTKLVGAIALALGVPFVVITIWVFVFGNPTMQRVLDPLEPTFGIVAYPVSIAPGFFFIWQLMSKTRLEPVTRRATATAIGLIYFPAMAYLIMLWAFILSLRVYGGSI